MMWAVDLTHTSHTLAQTGIQQVCRSLYYAWKNELSFSAVVYDPYSKRWRIPDCQERAILNDEKKSWNGRRSSRWSIRQKWRGKISNLINNQINPPEATGIFCPEIFDATRIDSLFSSHWSAGIKKVALFHDAIPVKYPQWCPQKTVAHFPSYLGCLAKFDHVICVSKTSQSDLTEYWDANDIPATHSSVISLGIPLNRVYTRISRCDNTRIGPTVLCVGTLEARKNHMALLTAAEELWKKGLKFNLKIAGMLNKSSGKPAARRISELKEKGFPVSWLGPIEDSELNELYSSSDIFLYASLYEGFGLPVLEALAFNLPVITTSHGALAESVKDGGCLVCDGSSSAIRDSLYQMLHDNKIRAMLTDQARDREVRTLSNTAREISAFLQDYTSTPKA